MRMDPEQIRSLIKRICIIGAFFAIALVFYLLGREGRPLWRGVLLVYALLVTAVMVLAILVQSGRGGGLAGLGGAGGESMLGARAATPIAKATYVLGALLLFICMLLARMGYQERAAEIPPSPIEEPEMLPEDPEDFPEHPESVPDPGREEDNMP